MFAVKSLSKKGELISHFFADELCAGTCTMSGTHDAWLQQYLRTYRSASIGYVFTQSNNLITNIYNRYVPPIQTLSKETGDMFALSQGIYLNWTSNNNASSIQAYQDKPNDPHPNGLGHLIIADVVLNQLALAILEACNRTKELLLEANTTDYQRIQTTTLSHFDYNRSAALGPLKYTGDDVFLTLLDTDYADRVIALYEPSSLKRGPPGMGLLCQGEGGKEEYLQEKDIFWSPKLANCSNLRSAVEKTPVRFNRTDAGYELGLPKCNQKEKKLSLKVPFPFKKVLTFQGPKRGYTISMTVNDAVVPIQLEGDNWSRGIGDVRWILPAEAPAGSIVSFCSTNTNTVVVKLRQLIAFLR